MALSFDALQQALAAWPNGQLPSTVGDDGVVDRIVQTLGTVEGSGGLLTADLLPLIRQYLLRETARRQQSVSLRVPSAPPWPGSSDWRNHGVTALSLNDKSFLLTALPWHPDWLGAGDGGVFGDSAVERVVRANAQCDIDPFIGDATGHQHYSSPGQREAVRAAFLMPPRHTLMVNLPTGSGKSLVGYAPALVNRQDGALTLFVVPTIALALDQERQLARYFKTGPYGNKPWPLAWHSGLPAEERSQVRSRLLDGTQRILLTSPEALVTSLLSTVIEAGRAGMLRYLVVDEAHLVTQWGDDFRPGFQALAGVRNALLRLDPASPLRTLLLSATFTQETVEVLANLFGPPERVHMVSAVNLRPEPQYWVHGVPVGESRDDRVLEALRHAPRPFILYVTRRDEADRWLGTLRTRAQLRRVDCFHGSTPTATRQSILERWSTNKLDGVVATSAFGVGVDKADIRTVIHATVPETLDRFYQEVGRGGRDGRSSASLLVHTPSDWSLPERLAKPKIISDELGLNRWKALYASRSGTDATGLFGVDINAIPEHQKGGNDYNVSWNMRTLLLMCRAGLIELDVTANDSRTEEGDAPSALAAMSSIRIRVLNHGHLLPAVWEAAIQPCREATYRSGSNSLGLLREMLLRNREVSSTLADLYRLSTVRWPVEVTRVCGGCTADRFSGANVDYHAPVAAPIGSVQQLDHSTLQKRFPWLETSPAFVYYDETVSEGEQSRGMITFCTWLIAECGFREIGFSGSNPLAKTPDFRKLYRASSDGVVIFRSVDMLDQEPYSPLGRITFLDPASAQHYLSRVRVLQRPHHVIILPKSTKDPENPHRLVSDTTLYSSSLESLLTVLTQ
jgi:ATP-dependent DNA helicase RecQ